MRPRVLIVCNAMDDAMRVERGITTDSPAASRKVFMLCNALRLAGVRPCILSLGRGSANGSRRYFGRTVRRVDGVPVVYAPFTHVPLISEVISLFAFVGTVAHFARHRLKAVIYYNRMIAYLPCLFTSALVGYRNVLDLEDGEVLDAGVLRFSLRSSVVSTFDRLCGAGALLACTALEQMTSVRPTLCYYGVVADSHLARRFDQNDVRILFSGTLTSETGADVLIQVIRKLRRTNADWTNHLSFDVAGQGDALDALSALVQEPGAPRIRVHGRLSDMQYRDLLMHCDVGLALKPINGVLANTTFPSKVVEYAGLGLLVLSTDISDVRKLMGHGARYLASNDPQELVCQLRDICDNREAARACAEEGYRTIIHSCSMSRAGRAVAEFVFGQMA